MITVLAAAAGPAPTGSFGYQSHGPDWGTILILTVIGGVAVFIAIMTAWLLHRFKGHRSLHLRSFAAGAFPVTLCFTLIIGGFVAIDGMRLDDAIDQFLGMNSEGWVFFTCCFIASWIAAFALGWWLRRKVVKSNHIDPAVFG